MKVDEHIEILPLHFYKFESWTQCTKEIRNEKFVSVGEASEEAFGKDVVQSTEDTRKRLGERGDDVDHGWDGSESECEQDVFERRCVWVVNVISFEEDG